MATRMRRHFLTGEWEEVECETENGRAVYHYGDAPERPARQSAIRPDKPWVSSTIAAGSPAEARHFNAELKKHGLLGSAYYETGKGGRLVCESRIARNKAMGLRRFGDSNAGYGDRPPGG